MADWAMETRSGEPVPWASRAVRRALVACAEHALLLPPPETAPLRAAASLVARLHASSTPTSLLHSSCRHCSVVEWPCRYLLLPVLWRLRCLTVAVAGGPPAAWACVHRR